MSFEFNNLPAVPVRKWADAFAVFFYLKQGYADQLTDAELFPVSQMMHTLRFTKQLKEPVGWQFDNAVLRSDGLLAIYRLSRPSKLTGQLTYIAVSRDSNPFCMKLHAALDKVDTVAEEHGREPLRLLAYAAKKLPMTTSCTPHAYDELMAYIAALPA